MIIRYALRRASILALATFVGCFGLGSAAFADSIDFADGTWNACAGNSSCTVGGTQLSTLGTGNITLNGLDGVGIGDDEIGLSLSGQETLRITFASTVTLQTVSITDLFNNDLGFLTESGQYSINGSGTFNTFAANSSTGDRLLTLNLSGVNSITFRAVSDLGLSDFSIRGLTYSTSVPEPSSLLFLGSAMTFVALTVRRRSYSKSKPEVCL